MSFSRGASRLLLALLVASGAMAAPGGGYGGYGGGGGGGFGGGDYTPPAPICPAYQCPKGQVSIGKTDHQIWSYGCKESGMNVFNAASMDPNNPYSGFGGGQKSLDKCCVERDICKQTCGMTSVECHDMFQKCQKKTCKGDQNCNLQAMIADISSEPYDSAEEKKDPPEKYDPEATKCKGYRRGQDESCRCVPSSEANSATEDKLKKFYKTHNPEKLDGNGEIKDVDEVYKKWTGKMPQMFMALATKYKAKAVEMRVKPKPPPYTPPPPKDGERAWGGAAGEKTVADADDVSSSSSRSSSTRDAPNAGHEDIPERKSAKKKSEAYEPVKETEDTVFDDQLAELTGKKNEAVALEDYDVAATLKEEMLELSKAEGKRLEAKKANAIEEEDYLEAKRVKYLLSKLEL